MITCTFGHRLTEKEWGEVCPFCAEYDEFMNTYVRLQSQIDPIKPSVAKDLHRLKEIFEHFNEYCDDLNRNQERI